MGTSDIAQDFGEALAKFKQDTGKDLAIDNITSVEDAVRQADRQQQAFSAFRHNKGQVDKLRSAFSHNIGLIQRIWNGATSIATAAGAFPPAMPVAPLMMAFTYVFQTFKDVSADYDRVMGFFDEMRAFLDRISMLQGHKPKLEPYGRCLKAVFTSMFSVCAIAADIKHTKRFKKFLHNLKDGAQDPDLAAAYSTMETAVQRLSEAMGIATYQAVSVVDGKVTRLEDDMKASLQISQRIEAFTIESSQTTQRIEAFAIETNQTTYAIREGLEDVDMKIDGLQRTMTTLPGNVASEVSQAVIQEMNKMLKQSSLNNTGTDARQTGKSKPQKARNEKGDASAKKPKALSAVKRHFADGAEVRKQIEAQRRDMSESFVEGTSEWILGDDRFKSWLAGSQRVAWLSGTAGLGKTFLAYAIVARLQDMFADHARTSIAYFYFREDDNKLRSFRDALRCTAVQIAEQDSAYCEQVAADISRNEDDQPWEQFFSSRYPPDSDAQLYLILDGVDEAREEDKPLMLSLFKQIAQTELNIHVLLTGRGELDPGLPDALTASIEVTRVRLADDMRMLIEARSRPNSRLSLPRLAKFRRHTKNRIRDTIMQSADGMLYVEHMLRRLNSIGREGAVLKDIQNMPNTMVNLYKLMLAECQRGRTHDQYLSLKALFAMCAYSKRALTLDEAGHLVNLTDPGHTFDVEDEIIGRSARILDTPRVREEDEEIEEYDEPAVPDIDNTGRTPVTFQDRSLRDYFRAISVEEDGLRTTPSLAHYTIFELLIKVLCSDEVQQGGSLDRQHLKDYAARYWAHHLTSIEVADLPDESVAVVLRGLSSLFRNKRNVSATFEWYGVHLYTALDRDLSIVEKLSAFVARAKIASFAHLDEDTTSWVRSIEAAPATAMLGLARGHVANWHKALRSSSAIRCWRGAAEALVVNGVEMSFTGRKEDILKVATYFDNVEMTADVTRTIGSALLAQEYYADAIEYSLKSIDMSGSKTNNAFYANWIIANAKYDLATSPSNIEDNDHAEGVVDGALDAQAGAQKVKECDAQDNSDGNTDDSDGGSDGDSKGDSEDDSDSGTDAPIQQATSTGPSTSKKESSAYRRKMRLEVIQHTHDALAALQEGWRDNHELFNDLPGVVEVLLQRAASESALKQSDTALATYNECRALGKLTGETLDEMACVRDWTDDSNGYITLLKSWTPQERVTWFGYLFEAGYIDDGNLHCYAKLSGPANLDFVVKCYDDFLQTLRRDSARRVPPQHSLATFYELWPDRSEKALELYWNTLTTEFKRDESDDLDETLLYTRLGASELIFSKFRETTDPSKKLDVMKEMEKLQDIRIGKGPSTSFEQSQSAVMLAIMTRSCGKAIDFEKILENSFQVCKDGLTDSVGGNDGPSLRLLAKVLACVPGLERDASIALSCQFSVIDPNVEHLDDSSSTSYMSSEDGEEEEDVDADASAGPDDGQQPRDIPNASEDAAGHANGSLINSGTTKGEKNPEPCDEGYVLLGLEKLEISARKVDTDPAKDNKNGTDNGSEDLVPRSECMITCDGDCDESIWNWKSQPMYLCIHCANTDLCEGCYQKRRSMDRGEPCTFWRTWCGQDHRFIKGPLKGWRGVKDGIIRIGQEEVSFKEWLEALEKDRWKVAWERFWKNESFLSNIGV